MGLAFGPHRALHPHPTSPCESGAGCQPQRWPPPDSARGSPTPRMSAANAAAGPLPTTFPRVHMPNLLCPARRCRRKSRARCASRSFRCALVALPDGVGWRREVKHTGTACRASSPVAEDFRVARGLLAGRVMVSRRQYAGRGEAADGSRFGRRKKKPSREVRSRQWLGCARCGLHLVHAAENVRSGGLSAAQPDDPEFLVKLWFSGGESRDNRTRRPG